MEKTILCTRGNPVIRFSIFILSILLLGFDSHSQTWHSGSSYRSSIVFDANDFDADITDFIYYFTISDADFANPDNCSLVKSANGYEFVFMDDEDPANILNHEIIEYNSTTGLYRGWVEIPTISSSINDTIYVYYGERGVVTDPSTANTYSTNVVSAWHFDAADQTADATVNARSLTISGATQSDGVLDESLAFDGTDDFVSVTDEDLGFRSGSFSIDGWINVQPKLGANPVEFVQITTPRTQHAEEPVYTTDGFGTNGNVIQLGRNVSDFNDFSLVGIRFNSVNIPQGSTISDAYIEFVADTTGSGFAKFSIDVEQSLNPEPFGTDSLPSTRILSENPVEWLPTAWIEGRTYRTSNIASLIEGIVDSLNWNNSNIALLIDGFGVREADNDGVNLIIEFGNSDESTLYQEQIVDGDDDAEEIRSDSTVTLTSPLTFDVDINNMVGIRFANVAVPNNAVIDSVFVQFTADASRSLDTDIRIYLEQSFDSEEFQLDVQNLSSRPVGSSISWTPDPWTNNMIYNTPDLGILFDNFFSDPSWTANNALTLLFEPHDDFGNDGSRVAKSRGAGADEGPQLLIYYHILENEPQTIVSRHDGNGGFSTWIDEFGKMNFAIDNDPTWDDPDVIVTSLENVDDKQWHHFGAVKEADKLLLYIDGEPQDSRSETHQTIVNLIMDPADDAEEEANVVDIGNNSLNFGSDSGGDDQIIGLRFQDVQIPSGATVISSFIQIISHGSAINTDPCSVMITGHQGNHESPFDDIVARQLSDSISTYASSPSVTWSIEEFNAESRAYNSPDISNIVEYNISSGWSQGNTMAFYVSGVSTGRRQARSRNSPTTGAGGAPTLIIEFKTSDYGPISGMTIPAMYVGDDTDYLGDSEQNLLGNVDHLRVYNTALSADKIRAQYRTVTDSTSFASIVLDHDQMIWTGGGGDGEWTTAENWNTGIAPWDNLDFVYTQNGTNLSPTSTLNIGSLEGTGSLNLGVEILNIDCACEIDQLTGNVQLIGDSVVLEGPSGEIQLEQLNFNSAGSNLYLQSDLRISNILTFQPGTGNIYANDNNVTFSQNLFSDTYSNTDNRVVLGAGTMTIENVPNGGSAIFHVSNDTSISSFSRVEIINNDEGADPADYTLQLCDYVNLEGTYAGGSEVTDDAVRMTWDITSISTDSDLALYWHENMEVGVFSSNRGTAEVNHHNGANWEILESDVPQNPSSQIWSVLASNVADFSPFGISSQSTPLPVELIHFEASVSEEAIVIKWETEVELNNDYYILEKSINGTDFSFMNQIDGSGTTNELTTYKIIDDSPVNGLQYYRLTQADFDGTIQNLGIRQVEFESQFNLDVFPNPTTNHVILSGLEQGNYEVSIISFDGKVVLNELILIEHRQASIDVSKFQKGFYILKLSTGSSYQIEKLLIE